MSATHVGWGSIRLEAVWMSAGEAAGFAAAMARKEETTVADINTVQLQRTLLEYGSIVAFPTASLVRSGRL